MPPRNNQAEAARALEVAGADYHAAVKAKSRARKVLNAAMVRCVKAGMSRREVARLTKTSPQWVRTVPGMPPAQGGDD